VLGTQYCSRCDREVLADDEAADPVLCTGCLTPIEDIEESVAFAAACTTSALDALDPEAAKLELIHANAALHHLGRRLADLHAIHLSAQCDFFPT
jgi:hypothetical protein